MKPTLSYRTVPFVAILAVALAVAGCGSSSKKSSSTQSAAPSSTSSTPSTTAAPKPAAKSSGGGGALKVSADPSGALKFTTTSLTAKAGKVTIDMNNPSAVMHGISVEGNGVDKTGTIVGQGATATVSATLKPGKYLFYCPVPGHKAAGMTGTLIVK